MSSLDFKTKTYNQQSGVSDEKWVKNLWKTKVLTEDQIPVLQKGLNFAITLKTIPKKEIINGCKKFSNFWKLDFKKIT